MKKRRANSTMASKTTASKKADAAKAEGAASDGADDQSLGSRSAELFSRAACQVSHWAGKPVVFLSAVFLVLIWAASGPLFGFSDTWQLVINTSTTIVTFLMVFLIQHTQNRDTLALQLKLAELIIAMQGAKNGIATAEDLSEEELERLHEEYRGRAEDTLDHLNRRRGRLKRAS
ncbi:MAG: low affinity iron permease family protein [Xanthobacteraceae bacterium]